MIRQTADSPQPQQFSCSPDGEPRGSLFRVGDLFPLSPVGDLLVPPPDQASDVRPWGLRFSRPAPMRAGKHEGGTNETTGHTDGSSPGEERVKD